MEFEQTYTDNTVLAHGKYKFTSLCRIPPEYLLSLHNNKQFHDQALVTYVANNLEKIKARRDGSMPTPELERVCTKIAFTKSDAKKELKRIRDTSQDHKKPIRSYECDKCGWWHLTSEVSKKFAYKKFK